jgi:hypothetical protein
VFACRFSWLPGGRLLHLATVLALVGLLTPLPGAPDASAQASCTTPSSPPTICIQDTTVVEGQRGFFAITLSQATNDPVEVFYSIQSIPANGDTATANQDFTPRTDSFMFPQGQTSVQLHVDTIDDTAVEGNETLTARLVSVAGATVGRGSATGTIIDNDGTPTPAITVSIDDDQRLEGNNPNGAFLVFFVTLSRAPQPGEVVNVDYQTFDGTATVQQDYRGAIGTLTFDGNVANPPTQQLIQVEIIGDRVPESPREETLTVRLTAVRGPATIADGEGQGTITDDDVLPTVTINRGGRVLEGNSGRRKEIFTLSLTDANGRYTPSPIDGLTVQYQTASGSAAGGANCPSDPRSSSVDFISTSGTIRFALNEFQRSFGVDVCGDTVDEPNLTFNVIISTNNATIGRGQAVVTIVNDDHTPPQSTPPTNHGTLGANGVHVGTTSMLQAPAIGSNEAVYKTKQGQLVSGIGTSVLAGTSPIISNDGASLVTDNGSGLISNDGGSLATDNGSALISNDGGGLISNDGGGLISNDGASFQVGR